MRVLVCDDEPAFQNKMRQYIEKVKKETEIPISAVFFKDCENAFKYYKENGNIDVFILDIKIPGMSGMELANKIRKDSSKVKIVFLSAILEEAPNGYRVNASYFWLKPLKYNKFLNDIKELYSSIKKELGMYLMEDIGGKKKRFYFEDILYIGTKNRKRYLYTFDEIYNVKGRLTEYEKILDSRFFRSAIGEIVNLDYIEEINNNELILSNGMRLYVSRSNKKRFRETYSKYLGKAL